VPLPESGHRFRDVIPHDGEPKGSRRLGASEVPVFDQLERPHDSWLPPWQAQVEGACSNCSPDPGHTHAPAREGISTLGLAGTESEVSQCLDEWTASRPGVQVETVDLLW